MRQFGLIGYPLGHSFSRQYFSEKFIREGIKDAYYELFPLPDIELLPVLLSRKTRLRGLNVTIPHKEAILPYLHRIDPTAEKIGAVNVVKITEKGELIGYNSDYYGFMESLKNALQKSEIKVTHALVLGTGGSSKAVMAALEMLNISYQRVSRNASAQAIAYENLTPEIIDNVQLIVNTTPLGMSPNVETAPALPFELLSPQHLCFDLVYNPLHTQFLQKSQEAGAHIQTGLEMLHLQAERAWKIWNT
jgi:shikimate dehydrogenase